VQAVLLDAIAARGKEFVVHCHIDWLHLAVLGRSCVPFLTNWLGTVYHGLPADSLRARFEPGSYLPFLGRLTKEKGPEVAMRIAR
jgi:glycosyltransferase involved in cell wall biosynthesis